MQNKRFKSDVTFLGEPIKLTIGSNIIDKQLAQLSAKITLNSKEPSNDIMISFSPGTKLPLIERKFENHRKSTPKR